MQRTVLLTIGRLPKALDLARAFASQGYRVIVADPFKWHLTGVSRDVTRSYQVTAPADNAETYLNDLSDIIDRERVDLIVPVSEETMYVAAIMARLGAGVAMFSMPQDFILLLHNKKRFIEFATTLGLQVPETYDIRDDRAQELAHTSNTVTKPYYSCSGRGVRFLKRGEAVTARSHDEHAIIQQRIDGDLYSTFSIAQSGVPCVTVIYRAAVMSGTVAVCFERLLEQPNIQNWVDQFIRKTSYTGFISFDMILRADGQAFAIECNPRANSGIHFLTCEDLGAAILDVTGRTTPRFRPQLFMQQVYPCLTETQKSLFARNNFGRNLRYLVTARDVTWQWRDPLPLLLMPITASQIIARSISKGETFGEASTFDISWREPDGDQRINA